MTDQVIVRLAQLDKRWLYYIWWAVGRIERLAVTGTGLQPAARTT